MESSRRLLVVDAGICICKISVGVLTTSCSHVDNVEAGETGWVGFQVKNYDLAITDNNMPKVSGGELVKKLRSERMTLPVALASGTIPTEALNANSSLRLAATLPKPFKMDSLVGTVKKALDGAALSA
ncbi:MAG TPA: response regulator [Candidatus Acidoferrum sp.]|nr:response regulator [Candidatus Acidoferrum sp.]